MRSASATISAGPSGERDADLQRRLQASRGPEPVERPEGIEIGAIVAGVEGRRRVRPEQQGFGRGTLVDADRRSQLQDLAAAMGDQLAALGGPGDVLGQAFGRELVRGAAPVQGDDRTLVLEPQPGPFQLGRIERAGEYPGRPRQSAQLRRGARLGRVRQQQLEAVVADVGQLLDADDPPRHGRPPAGDDHGRRVAVGDPRQRDPDAIADPGQLRTGDDLGQGPVEVAEDRSGGRVIRKRGEHRLGRAGLAGARDHSSSIAPCPRTGRCASP